MIVTLSKNCTLAHSRRNEWDCCLRRACRRAGHRHTVENVCSGWLCFICLFYSWQKANSDLDGPQKKESTSSSTLIWSCSGHILTKPYFSLEKWTLISVEGWDLASAAWTQPPLCQQFGLVVVLSSGFSNISLIAVILGRMPQPLVGDHVHPHVTFELLPLYCCTKR